MQGIATKSSCALGLAIALALAGPSQPAAADADTAKGVKAQGPRAKGGVQVRKAKPRGKEPLPGGPEDESALWWNDPGIQKALSLSDEQRKKIEAYLAAFRAKVPPKVELQAFHETLVQRDWKQARSENKKLAERAEASVGMRGKLKIDVLLVLTPEQHQILVDKFPRLIYKPWARAMRGSAAR
jgi:Spy/CpxP family protein refolding chaperone